jgi:hypothetical protein
MRNDQTIEHSRKMLGMIEEWQKSGVSKKEFCINHEIAQWKFYYWLKRYNQKENNEPGHFVPVRTGKKKPVQTTGLEIQYPNGVKLMLPAGTGIQIIRAMIGLI